MDYTTSADNTETEPEGSERPDKKAKRKSRLLWSLNSDANGSDSKLNTLLASFTSSPGADEGKSPKRLQKKRVPKGSDVHINVATTGKPSSIKPPDSEMIASEPGARTLSPRPWTHQSNISQSSLNPSEYSRRSRISSNQSSIDGSRSGTPTDKPVTSIPPTTFEAIQHNMALSSTDDLSRVIMPAARRDRPRASSLRSDQSVASSSKGSKIGAWIRKKRGYSVSSSTSAGGGGSD